MRAFIRHGRVTRDAYRGRTSVYQFYDPYWYVQGSSIEKMVMGEFIRRGIYFEHTPQTNTVGNGVDPSWEPDFLLPQFKIWIEIQGAYFHTLPGQLKTDALRYAVIQEAGWRPMFWWEWDIRARLVWLMDQVPEFYFVDAKRNKGKVNKAGAGVFYEGGTGIDHLKGLRTALRNRAKPAGADLTIKHRLTVRIPK